MSRHTRHSATDVRLLPPGQLDGGLADALAAQQLAEITHLPTGIASGHIATVQVPARGSLAVPVRGTGGTLLHVVDGLVRVKWGNSLDRSMEAGAGDTLLVPAGTACQADNPDLSAAVQLILVRGG